MKWNNLNSNKENSTKNNPKIIKNNLKKNRSLILNNLYKNKNKRGNTLRKIKQILFLKLNWNKKNPLK